MLNSFIFDIDGTIVNVTEGGIYTLYSTISKQLHKKIPVFDSMKKHYYGIDEQQIFDELNVTPTDFWDVFKKNDNPGFRTKFLIIYKDISIISQLQNMGAFIGFNTDAPHTHGKIQLQKAGFVNPYIVSNHNGIPRKPNPGGLMRIISDNNLDPSKTAYIGNTEKDIIAGIRAGIRTIFINRGNISSLNVTPDYVVKSLDELLKLPELYCAKLKKDINIDNLSALLSREEKICLDVHFKRVRHHSLVMGLLCESLNEYLELDKKQAFAFGIFHDLDYAKSFFNMNKHGYNSRYFIDDLLTESLYADISEHTNKFSNNKRSLFLYAMEGWIKRFIHSARSNNKPINLLSLKEIQHVYDSKDPRRNELLTRYDTIESFQDFLDWQDSCSAIVKSLPIKEEQLYFKAKEAFHKYNSIISYISVGDEGRLSYGN